jgi:hypothetical protein
MIKPADTTMLFEKIERRLGPGWECLLISIPESNVVRLKLSQKGGLDPLFRKTIQAETFEQALAEADRFTHQYTPEEYTATLAPDPVHCQKCSVPRRVDLSFMVETCPNCGDGEYCLAEAW